jgi:hypothetical protein
MSTHGEAVVRRLRDAEDSLPRRRYFTIDRHKLAYLNGIEKINCTFCSYADGLIAYVREVAARTEQYWCPIKHARQIPQPHSHYERYFEYGDAAGYRNSLTALRKRLAPKRLSMSPQSRRAK